MKGNFMYELEQAVGTPENDYRDIGRQEGAIAFCTFLRGFVAPETLLEAWEAFNKNGAHFLKNPATYETVNGESL